MDDRDVETMSDSELLSDLDVTRAKLGALESRELKILDRLEQNKYAKTLGAHDLPRLLAHRYRLDLADATRRVKLAVDLRKYPAVAAALPTPGNVIPEDGVVLNLAQARAIMSALEQIPKSANVPVEELDAAAAQMVQAARHMKPNELQSMGVQVRNILDTDGPEPREDAARQREEVWVTKAEDGVKFGGYLAGENAEKLQTVLQTGAKPHKTEDGELDPRSRGKRQADALVDALDIALASGDLPARGGVKPHITVTIDLDDLTDAGKQATGDLTYGDGLSASAIRRLACDAGIIPVVLGSDSQPLDVGREKRYVTDGLRNALNQRDRGCVVCHAPPIYCDAHHLISWADGGATSLANLVLLCRVDHTSLHDGHWTITIIDNQVQVTRPTWADPPRPDTGRRLDSSSSTPATAPATTATTPWPQSTGTAAPPATPTPTPTPTSADADPWPSEATAEGSAPADAEPRPPRASAAADPWPAPTATGGPPATPAPTSADADPWPSEATAEGSAPADAEPRPPRASAAADPWPAPTATGGPPATPAPTSADADPWPSEATAERSASPNAEPWPPPAKTAAAPWPARTAAEGSVSADAEPWPSEAAAEGPASADTDRWPPPVSEAADPWPSEATAEGAASVEADSWPPVATTGADSWPVPTAAGADLAVADGSTDTKSATIPAPPTRPAPPARPAAASGPGVAARLNWPYNDDAAWISAEEAAELDPWGDNSVDAGLPAMPGPTSGSTRGRSRVGGAPWSNPEEAAALDTWGDGPVGAVIPPGVPAPADTSGGGLAWVDEDSWATPDEAADVDPWADSA
ncbi:DUF222 domain-containing protein [Kribbella sp. NBC_00382]|uniref:DUF222 domain-containing protein n=1 Tax=Kribbella sp. NBC_00382 TaxID=2975967 RepID=UPI002E24DE59